MDEKEKQEVFVKLVMDAFPELNKAQITLLMVLLSARLITPRCEQLMVVQLLVSMANDIWGQEFGDKLPEYVSRLHDVGGASLEAAGLKP